MKRITVVKSDPTTAAAMILESAILMNFPMRRGARMWWKAALQILVYNRSQSGFNWTILPKFCRELTPRFF